ncbi:MAG: hydroxymethylpyrimidine/phosphomethylpyrimidine kinase [Deltaproteobacteria bacterium]|nr:hydroxymethylpyrimidine/phosphomethylpyrimidine kinase [Deltaproteobacteria bacterium]
MIRTPIPFVLAIGGFDPSCGAGVGADVRTFDCYGVAPLAVVTALTIQAGTGVKRVHATAAAVVEAQLAELLAHFAIAAVKIGQIPSAATARLLRRRLVELGAPVVLDPVLRASGGGRLASDAAEQAIARSLVPVATLLTVNLDEARVLAGRRVRSLHDMHEAAAMLAERGARAVLVKGGHMQGDPVDVLWHRGRVRELRGRRLTGSMHGTGCALASAAAAMLAGGATIEEAVVEARAHVRRLISGALVAGKARLRSPAR